MCDDCGYPGELAQQEPDDGDFYPCDGCTCCSYAGCHGGEDSECPVNSTGDFICPCTEG